MTGLVDRTQGTEGTGHVLHTEHHAPVVVPGTASGSPWTPEMMLIVGTQRTWCGIWRWRGQQWMDAAVMPGNPKAGMWRWTVVGERSWQRRG